MIRIEAQEFKKKKKKKMEKNAMSVLVVSVAWWKGQSKIKSGDYTV